jgi:demethylmenaquinone methyltransferase/2-methoxy-6-polyprenyl-1,4-benzoquinol methylase
VLDASIGKSLLCCVALRATISTPHGKRQYVRRLFATSADRYDLITRVLSYGQDRRWKARAITLVRLTPDDRVLDLACGTGDLMFAAASQARQVIGVDLTFRMLQLAAVRRSSLDRERASKCQVLTGDMIALPVAGARFDVVTTGYGLRNVPDLAAAIDEIHRVLVPGGRLVSLDFNRPSNALVRSVYWLYLTIVGSALGWVLHGDPDTYRYIPESIRNYPGAAGVAEMLRRRGFTDVVVIPVLAGFMAIHVARRAKPA